MSSFRALNVGMWLGIIALYTLFALSQYHMFQKAGEQGWKAFVPFYNSYIYYQITWKTSMFWLAIVFSAIGCVVRSLIRSDSSISVILTLMLTVIVLILLMLSIVSCHKTSRAYGHGAGFTIGLVFLPLIFQFIIGFGKSKYMKVQNL